MARFDVYRFSAEVPFVVEVQADILSHLESVVVVPLLQAGEEQAAGITRICPTVRFLDDDYVLIGTDIAGIPRKILGAKVGSIADQRGVVVDALDFLMQGF